MKYLAYTDGACAVSTKQGGIGIVILKNDEVILTYKKSYQNTTNQRMEVQAAILALKCIVNPIDEFTIYSDSMYLIGTMTKGWKRKCNTDLWDKLDSVIKNSKVKKINWIWVKGHADNEYNSLADNLAQNASKEI